MSLLTKDQLGIINKAQSKEIEELNKNVYGLKDVIKEGVEISKGTDNTIQSLLSEINYLRGRIDQGEKEKRDGEISTGCNEHRITPSFFGPLGPKEPERPERGPSMGNMGVARRGHGYPR